MRERDRGSFEEWARARQQQLVRRAYLVTGDHHRAEDLVQEALVGVAMRWDTLRDGDPDAWVRTVVYRANVSWWRRHRREVSVDRVPDHVGSPGPGPARLAIEDALQALTTKQRATLLLRFLEDLSVEETAAVLGVSTGTVKKQTSVALERLREHAPHLRDLTLAEEAR